MERNIGIKDILEFIEINMVDTELLGEELQMKYIDKFTYFNNSNISDTKRILRLKYHYNPSIVKTMMNTENRTVKIYHNHVKPIKLSLTIFLNLVLNKPNLVFNNYFNVISYDKIKNEFNDFLDTLPYKTVPEILQNIGHIKAIFEYSRIANSFFFTNTRERDGIPFDVACYEVSYNEFISNEIELENFKLLKENNIRETIRYNHLEILDVIKCLINDIIADSSLSQKKLALIIDFVQSVHLDEYRRYLLKEDPIISLILEYLSFNLEVRKPDEYDTNLNVRANIYQCDIEFSHRITYIDSYKIFIFKYRKFIIDILFIYDKEVNKLDNGMSYRFFTNKYTINKFIERKTGINEILWADQEKSIQFLFELDKNIFIFDKLRRYNVLLTSQLGSDSKLKLRVDYFTESQEMKLLVVPTQHTNKLSLCIQNSLGVIFKQKDIKLYPEASNFTNTIKENSISYDNVSRRLSSSIKSVDSDIDIDAIGLEPITINIEFSKKLLKNLFFVILNVLRKEILPKSPRILYEKRSVKDIDLTSVKIILDLQKGFYTDMKRLICVFKGQLSLLVISDVEEMRSQLIENKIDDISIDTMYINLEGIENEKLQMMSFKLKYVHTQEYMIVFQYKDIIKLRSDYLNIYKRYITMTKSKLEKDQEDGGEFSVIGLTKRYYQGYLGTEEQLDNLKTVMNLSKVKEYLGDNTVEERFSDINYSTNFRIGDKSTLRVRSSPYINFKIDISIRDQSDFYLKCVIAYVYYSQLITIIDHIALGHQVLYKLSFIKSIMSVLTIDSETCLDRYKIISSIKNISMFFGTSKSKLLKSFKQYESVVDSIIDGNYNNIKNRRENVADIFIAMIDRDANHMIMMLYDKIIIPLYKTMFRC
jgi:hypothetical protein